MMVYRYPEGISLNGKEYLLDDNNNVLHFDDYKTVQNYLEIDLSEEDLIVFHGIFIEEER